MTPSEQQIIDQLHAAAAEWMARRNHDGPLEAANGVPPAPEVEQVSVDGPTTHESAGDE